MPSGVLFEDKGEGTGPLVGAFRHGPVSRSGYTWADYDIDQIPEADSSLLRWDGSQVVVDQQAELDATLDSSLQAIDAAAEKARGRHVTNSYIKGGIYREKAEQAQAFKDAGYPEANLSSYPALSHEAARRGLTGQQLTDEVLARRFEWLDLMGQIEAESVGGKDDARAAHASSDRAGIEAAKDSAVAALDAL